MYLLDILEHVKDPYSSIKEAKRVTKPEGLIFIEFSPFYAYPTGHHLYSLGFPKGFLPFQFLPISITKYLVLNSKLNTKDNPSYVFEQFTLLNKLSVSRFEKLLRLEKLKVIGKKSFVVLPHKEIYLRYFGKIPLLKELITMSYSTILKKERFI